MSTIKDALKSGINSLLDDGNKTVTRNTLRIYGKNDWRVINNAISDWKSRGLLNILKDPETANEGDVCIEMLHYIDRHDFDNWPPGNKSTDTIR